jgi:hypothetical protein
VFRIKLSRVALALASVTAFGLGGVLPAQAATCTYNGCSGKDPQSSGCSSGSTTLKDFTTAAGVHAELRYSSTCKAVWTRISASCVPLNKPYLETGYIDYYGTYHRQGVFRGGATLGGCTGHDNPPREVLWTPMSSVRRERLRFGVDDHGTLRTYVHLTGCNDCY